MSISPEALAVITEAKAFCLANYDKGFDAFVEAYEDSEWLEEATNEAGELMSWPELKESIIAIQKLRANAQEERW